MRNMARRRETTPPVPPIFLRASASMASVRVHGEAGEHLSTNLAAVVVVVRELLDDEETEEVAFFVGSVEHRRQAPDGVRDASHAKRVPLLASEFGHDERRGCMCAGLGGALPAEHLHQLLHDGGRRADQPQCGIPKPRARCNVDEDADAHALLVYTL